MKEKPNYYAIIPASVRYDKSLTPNAKLLYAEITALCNMNGKCTASTQYFCKLYEVSRASIQNWLRLLDNHGYIERDVIYKKGSKEILSRSITLVDKPKLNIYTDNTNININNNNITYSNKDKHTWVEFKKMEFGAEISEISAELQMPVEMANDFLNYWSEKNKSKTKMRYELERTWDLRARMIRWKNNTKKWNTKRPASKLKAQLDTYSKAREMIDKINDNKR